MRALPYLIALLALLLAHTGCNKSASPTTPEPEAQSTSCDALADHAAALLQQDDEVAADRAGELRDVMVRVCTDDEWPEAARTCMRDATDHNQLEECAHQFLSDEQYRRAGDEMERVLDDSEDGQIGLPPE